MTGWKSLIAHDAVRTVALIGAGSVGRGWAALLLATNHDVIVFDPRVDQDAVTAFVEAAWPSLERLGITTSAFDRARLRFAATLEDAVGAADLVFENAPEDEAVKIALIAAIDALLASDRPIFSSSGGIRPTVLQRDCAHPARVLVAHPFNPPHLVPLVEIVGGERTDPAALAWARTFIAGLGKRPIVLKREMAGHLANRFQAALMREVFHCVIEDVASPQDIDDALRFGLGLRWAVMGGIMTFNLAGGRGGAAHTLDLARNAYADWWADLGTVTLDEEVEARIRAAAEAVEDGTPIQDWMAWRDAALVDVVSVQNAWIARP